MSSTSDHDERALPAGKIVERYRIERVLGSGGFGITYLAKHKRLGRKVALKECFPADLALRRAGDLTIVPNSGGHSADYAWALERFESEAQTLASLKHPSIVSVIDVFEANGTAYMVMDFEEGVDLEVRLERLGRAPSEAELSSWLDPLLEGLEVVHDAGILHRDIKPENIFITTDGRPVLLDFGSARQVVGGRTRPMTSVLTPGYAPFEQYPSGETDQGTWTDIYSLCATLHRSLTGEAPPEAALRVRPGREDPYKLLVNRLSGKYSQVLLVAVDAGLEVNERKRPQTVLSFRELLEMEETPSNEGDDVGSPITISEQDPLENGDADRKGGGQSRSSALGWLLTLVVLAALITAGINSWSGDETGNQEYAEPRSLMENIRVGSESSSEISRTNLQFPQSPAWSSSPQWPWESKIVPDLGLEMVWIKPGKFRMGSPTNEADRNDNEGPQLDVTLTQGYWLGKYEVTQQEWESLMGNNPSTFEGSLRPVENVSWEDAQEFCRKLTERERAVGRLPESYAYSLPTEAQWEYACRAGTTGSFAGNLSSMAWYSENSDLSTHPVGQKRPNAWGLYDMHGNLWEWCQDWYKDSYEGYPNGTTVTNPVGPASGSDRVRRGGSWNHNAQDCRSACRSRSAPTIKSGSLGFRLCLRKVQ